jgi:hypothetical protein
VKKASMPSVLPLVLLPVLSLAACSSKITQTLDEDLQKRIETVTDCFPGMLSKLQALLALADTWRLNRGGTVDDPPGLAWSEQPDGTIDLTFGRNGTTFGATITFYSPAGLRQNLDLSGASSLNEAIDLAATELLRLFGTTDKFMVGDWNLSGTGVAGNGALTGILGGSTHQNELVEIRTTTAVPIGGPPPIAAGTIQTSGADDCTLTFLTEGLQTDTAPTQEYPIGSLTFTLQGPEAAVVATMVFDGTATAVVTVEDIRGSFAVDLETRQVTHRS